MTGAALLTVGQWCGGLDPAGLGAIEVAAAGTLWDPELHPRGEHGKFATTASLGRELYRLAATEPDQTQKDRLGKAARAFAGHDLPGAANWLRAIAERHPDPGPLTDLAARIETHHAQSRQVPAPEPATDSARRVASSLDAAVATGGGTDSIPGQDVAIAKPKGGPRLNYFGNTADTRMVTFPDGSRWVRKRHYPEAEMDAEVAYSRISDVFGAGAPPVIKRRYGDGEWETWQPVVPRAETAIEWSGGADPVHNPRQKMPPGRDLEALFTSPQGQLIGLVDQVATGADRHMGNWMVRRGPDGDVPVPIDNSNAKFRRFFAVPESGGGFRRGVSLSDSPFAMRLDPAKLADQHPADQWDEWQAGLEALEPEFDGLGMNEELANVYENLADVRVKAGR